MMSIPSETEIIFEHALKNQENLEIALDIGFAFQKLRKRIIRDFLDKLKEFVLDKLRGDKSRRSGASEWEVSGDSHLRDSPLEKLHYFSFRKKSWGEEYGVGLQPHEANACEVIIGVWRRYDEKTRKGARRFQPRDRLRKELNEKIRPGGTGNNNYWEWDHPLDNPYRNWNTKEALIKLHNGEAVEHIGKELVQIIEVAAPIIDVHIEGSSKNKTAR